MRSVVVVLPASTWAMMPILRISERGVVRGIARFRKKCNELRRGRPASKPRILTRQWAVCRDNGLDKDVQSQKGLSGQPGIPRTPAESLSHAVTASLETGPLSPKIIGTPAGCRSAARLGRVEPGLRSGPAMALELILPLLLLALRKPGST